MHKSACPALWPSAIPAPRRTYLVSTPTRRAGHIVETLLAVVVEHVGGIREVRLAEIHVPVEVANAYSRLFFSIGAAGGSRRLVQAGALLKAVSLACPLQIVCIGSALFPLCSPVPAAAPSAEAAPGSLFCRRFCATPALGGTTRFDPWDR
jgi:hypothetical protein